MKQLTNFSKFMITDEDIKKFTEVFATRDEIVTKPDFEDLKKDFNDLQIAIDGYANKADTYFQEMLMLSRKVDRHEQWIHELAEKVGVKLGY